MKNNYILFRVLVVLILLFKPAYTGELSLRISKTTINSTLGMLIKAKALGFTEDEGSHHSWGGFSNIQIYFDNVTLDLIETRKGAKIPKERPNAILNIGTVHAKANFDIMNFGNIKIPLSATGSMKVGGKISIVAKADRPDDFSEGFVLVFRAMQISDLYIDPSFLPAFRSPAFYYFFPEIYIYSYVINLPNIPENAVIQARPYLSVNENEIVVSVLPRVVAPNLTIMSLSHNGFKSAEEFTECRGA